MNSNKNIVENKTLDVSSALKSKYRNTILRTIPRIMTGEATLERTQYMSNTKDSFQYNSACDFLINSDLGARYGTRVMNS